MFESVITAIIRQAALLTKPQQEEFANKAADTLATLILSTDTEIDDELARTIVLPLTGQILGKLQEKI